MIALDSLNFCKKWAASLASQNQLSPDREAEITFALELLVINIFNLAFTLLLGWILGVFTLTLVCIITVTLFRHTAGGAHSDSPWRCAFFTILFFPLMALFARYLSFFSYQYMDMLMLAGIITGLLLLLRYSPYETPQAPIISPLRRAILRKLSFMALGISAAIMAVLSLSSWPPASLFQMGIFISMLWATINLTPLARKVWHRFDQITPGFGKGGE